MTFPKRALAASVAAVAAGLSLPAGIQAAPAALSGDALFRQRCAMCHQVAAGRASPLGPNLRGVVGRKAGSTTFNYSPAMKASGLTWNAATLDSYLLSPQRTVPGTKMMVSVPNAAQRRALIGYRNTLR
jgi:cytochrome c